jgi:hypothetical protein
MGKGYGISQACCGDFKSQSKPSAISADFLRKILYFDGAAGRIPR